MHPKCDPHLRRGLSVEAYAIVAGTPMCASCFAGRPVSALELAGEQGSGPDRATKRNYYNRNRSGILATRKKRRKLAACMAS